MSHHYSGADFGFPHGDARLDLADLYAFPKPGDAGKSILIMNVHPSSSINPPELTTADPFATEALYELKIDTNGDAVADIAYRVRFSPSKGGVQTATLRRVEGAQAVGTGDGGQAIVEGAPVSMGREARVTQAGDYRFFAGWRSDPFFFDVRGALNNLQCTGDDFFADKDVCSIVLEVPNSALEPKEVGLMRSPLLIGSKTNVRETLVRRVLQEVQNQMRPEIFDRFDRVLVFNRLSYEVQIEVGRLHLLREIETQKHRGYRVGEWDAEALKAIVRSGYSEKQGARRMRNAAREAVQEAIRDALLSGKEASGRLRYDGQMKAFFLNGQS